MKTKNTKHTEKMKLKRAVKAAKRAKYEALAGTSKKEKRIVKRVRSRASSSHKHSHSMANCGNIGCMKCNPRMKSLHHGAITQR